LVNLFLSITCQYLSWKFWCIKIFQSRRMINCSRIDLSCWGRFPAVLMTVFDVLISASYWDWFESCFVKNLDVVVNLTERDSAYSNPKE
jgi:hypothetical protein